MIERLEALARTRRGAAWLFAAALAVYWLVSLALPLVPGRDFPTYVAFWVQLDEWDSVVPMTMLFRTPVAPIVAVAPLDLLGPWVAQAWMSVLYAGSIVAWSAVASRAGSRAALLTGAALLVSPGYVILFHRLASDAVSAAAFAAWALLLARALDRPGTGRFALVGLAGAVFALTRPANQAALVLLAAVPLVLALPWRRRVAYAAAALGTAVIVLGGWAVNNGVRYDDTTVARGGAAYLPFFRTLVTDRLVEPANGPASRELAAAVEREVLPREPYRSRDIDVDTFFAQASDRMFEDVVNVSDIVWGWDSDYAHLRDVALEAVRERPSAFVEGVGRTLWQLVWWPTYYELPDADTGSGTSSAGAAPPTGAAVPISASDGELIPAASRGLYITTPERSIDEVWKPSGEHRVVFADPADGVRFDAMLEELRAVEGRVPAYGGNAELVHQLSRSSRLWPPAIAWLVVGAVAVALRRPRRALDVVAAAIAGALVLLANGASVYAAAELAMPVIPAFVALAAVGLLGERQDRLGTFPRR
jgi:hypothetical protein